MTSGGQPDGDAEEDAAGHQVAVGSTHGGHTRTVRIVTTKAPNGPVRRSGSSSLQRVAPFKVTIRLANIGGPSAGLMFTLGIVEKVGKAAI